jgi:integrase
MSTVLLDAAGCRRSPATMPGFHSGRPPHNKGVRYPADPPSVEEIVAVMRHEQERRPTGLRMRGLIVSLWRAGLRIHEALALIEADLDARRGSVLVRRGKGGRRREVGMDDWAWEQLQQWLSVRVELPVGSLFCILTGPTRGRTWSQAAAREQLRHTAALAGVRRRFAPHQLRHAHAVEMAREGVPLMVIQRQLGHTNLGITSPGRAGARCRRYRRSVSPTRPPNRTCPFPGIRLSAGHVVADLDAVVMRRRLPAAQWLGLFRCPPTARGCCDRDSGTAHPASTRSLSPATTPR